MAVFAPDAKLAVSVGNSYVPVWVYLIIASLAVASSSVPPGVVQFQLCASPVEVLVYFTLLSTGAHRNAPSFIGFLDR